ncbi:VOC family protein [Ferrovibrio sp.]|uniref:VOC family protein n=1 Tax=Ferrovibrio sp. TaxID=1917215 RepID=UPI0035179598
MLQLDHITILAPSLPEGVAHVRDCLDIDVPFGRQHQDMGTHNHLLRLGDALYLEIIAINPGAPRPGRPRWFGLDDQPAVRAAWDDGRRLRGWVARTTDIDGALAGHEAILGRKVRLTSGDAVFFFAIPEDGALPMAGAAPSVIDRQGRPPPVAAMADFGATLQSLVIEHPQPAQIRALYDALDIDTPPTVRAGGQLRYLASIGTPRGIRQLF